MSDYILIDGDLANFMPSFGAAIVVVRPGTLTASGASKFSGKNVCVEGDEGSAPVILICRSGKRSKEAGQALIDAGISNIYHIDEGFEGELDENHHRSTSGGWRYHKLPWQQC